MYDRFIDRKCWPITGVPGEDYEEEIFVEGLTYRDWQKILKYVVVAHCIVLSFIHMKTHVAKMVKWINQIEFPALKILYINWAHIYSLEFLA